MFRLKKTITQRGSMLLFVMIITALLSIFCVTFSSSITTLQKHVWSNYNKSSIQYNIVQMKTLMKLPNALVDSSGLLENQKLYTCTEGGSALNCTNNCCVGNVESGFSYLDPADPTINPNLRRKLSAPPESPVFYNENGSICSYSSVNSEHCAFSISTSFTAICPNAEDRCAHAEHLKIKLQFNPKPENVKTLSLKQPQTHEFIYFVNRNYQPRIETDNTLALYMDGATEKEVTISGNSGHPAEKQNFIFTKCVSENPNIAQITTPFDQPFDSGTSVIRVKPVALGTTRLVLQISDGGLENNLSPEMYIDVTVLPGAGS